MAVHSETPERRLALALSFLMSVAALAPPDAGSQSAGAGSSPQGDRTTEVLRAALAAMAERSPRDTVHLATRWDSGDRLPRSRVDALLAGDYAVPVVARDSADLSRDFRGAVLEFGDLEVEGASATIRAEYHTVHAWDRTIDDTYEVSLADGERGWKVDGVQLEFHGDGYVRAPDDSSRRRNALRAALRHAADSIPRGDRYVHTSLSPPDSATPGQEMAARILGAGLISLRDAVECPASDDGSLTVHGPVVGMSAVDFTGSRRAEVSIGWRTDADLDAPGYAYDELDVWLEEESDGSWRVVRSRIDPNR